MLLTKIWISSSIPIPYMLKEDKREYSPCDARTSLGFLSFDITRFASLK